MSIENSKNPLAAEVALTLEGFCHWLDNYGETSWDHQSFFAGKWGSKAKALYYRNRKLGSVAVAPMIFFEAFFPAARRFFHQRIRLPIADAHFAMGFAFLYQVHGQKSDLKKSRHFLDELKKSRCPGFEEYCWGYPFDWVTRTGVIAQGTPLITTTPYVYEAFLQMDQISGRGDEKEILASIARHARFDLGDTKMSEAASSCSYGPGVEGRIINASAYRAFLLTSAGKLTGNDDYLAVAGQNLNFVLENQNADGSWPYAKDGVRDFVDHFHTCFVMKALAKIHSITGQSVVLEALEKGTAYYLKNLFGEDGMPRPFSRAPRVTVYRCELYDCAECINLCLLLRDRIPGLDQVLQRVVAGILENWIKRDGSFRSRRLIVGWDNMPMHRWAQSQMFRSLAFYISETVKAEKMEGSKVSCAA